MGSYRAYFPECPYPKFREFFTGHKKGKDETTRYIERGNEVSTSQEYKCQCAGKINLGKREIKINLSGINEVNRQITPEGVACFGLIGCEDRDAEVIKNLLQPIKMERDK